MIPSQSLLDDAVSRAHNSGAASDYAALFSMLHGVELFFATSENGQQAQLTPVGGARHAVRLFTSREAPSLGKFYAGIIWGEALQMAMNMPEADGVIVQTDNSDWIAIDKRSITALLSSPN